MRKSSGMRKDVDPDGTSVPQMASTVTLTCLLAKDVRPYFITELTTTATAIAPHAFGVTCAPHTDTLVI